MSTFTDKGPVFGHQITEREQERLTMLCEAVFAGSLGVVQIGLARAVFEGREVAVLIVSDGEGMTPLALLFDEVLAEQVVPADTPVEG
jgi:hypothetical protein